MHIPLAVSTQNHEAHDWYIIQLHRLMYARAALLLSNASFSVCIFRVIRFRLCDAHFSLSLSSFDAKYLGAAVIIHSFFNIPVDFVLNRPTAKAKANIDWVHDMRNVCIANIVTPKQTATTTKKPKIFAFDIWNLKLVYINANAINFSNFTFP